MAALRRSTSPLSAERRSRLLVRLAEVRISLGEYQSAYEVLQVPNGPQTSAELAPIKFRAAVLAGHYDDAATLNGDVRTWLALLDDLIDRRPQAASAVRDEIRRRFNGELDGEAGEHLRVAEERLMQTTLTSGAGGGNS